MLEVRLLTADEMREVYESHMLSDFPENERKPFARIQELLEAGFYEAYGVFEGEKLLAYAWFMKGKLGRYVLLDYLAVCKEYRSQGYGSRLLPLLQEAMSQQYEGILGEVEDPDFGEDEADIAVRRRRLCYYERYGFQRRGLYCTLFGPRLCIISYEQKGQKEADDREIYQAMDDIYQVMFHKNQYPGEITLNYLEN
ncbi:MAG: GNAT family N-acetyltransferase [bacterium]|nr:GNAT family N-acetyltransferase [bacterium]